MIEPILARAAESANAAALLRIKLSTAGLPGPMPDKKVYDALADFIRKIDEAIEELNDRCDGDPLPLLTPVEGTEIQATEDW